jgi:hypothetical protein
LARPTAWKVACAPTAAVGRLPSGAVAGDEQHLVEALARLEPRVADLPLLEPLALLASLSLARLGVPDTLEVDGEYGIEAAEGLLLGGEGVAALPVRVGGADLLELCRLVAVRDFDLAHAPRLAALLEGGVVQVAVVGKQPHRAALLRARRVGPQLVGAFHRGSFCNRVVQRIVASDNGTTVRLRSPPLTAHAMPPYSPSDPMPSTYREHVSIQGRRGRWRFCCQLVAAVPSEGT